MPDVDWDEDTESAIEDLVKTIPGTEYPSELKAKFTIDTIREIYQTEFLREHITELCRGEVVPALYPIWWADNSQTWSESLDDTFSDVDRWHPKLSGPVIVISLHGMDHEILEAAKRPFFQDVID